MTETKMKPMAWHERPRMNRIASIMYPSLADPDAQRDMAYYSKLEGRQPPVGLPDAALAEPRRSRSRFPPDYSKVPGLVRKR